MKNIIVLFLLPFLFYTALTQDLQIDSTLTALPDTVCYKLKFNAGDTLTYRIVSYDSVAIDYGKPLLKTRFERVMFVCDSVVDNKFFMSRTLMQYIAYESSGDIRNVERTENPWVGRTVWFVIDSVGNRYALGYDDSTKAALSPGGAFQPHLLFPFQNSCMEVDKTWMSESLDELVENGLPLPLIKQSSLFRALPAIDTLDEHCNRLSYIKTAQGSYQVKSGPDTIRVTNIITGYGVLDISSDKHIPVHYLATVEQKMTISIGNNEPKPGWHYIASYYTLDNYKPGKKPKPEIKKRF
ncbi:hypothetical protein ACFLSQ_08630 [Bacteroidota bacterium]